MKLAVINFSGNVGKTTLARHLLLPRIPGAEYIAVESFNAGAEGVAALRGNQFAMLQEYLHSGASGKPTAGLRGRQGLATTRP